MSRNVIHEIATSSIDVDAVNAVTLVEGAATVSLAYGPPDTMPDGTLSVVVGEATDKTLITFSGAIGITGGAGYVYVDILLDSVPIDYCYFYYPVAGDATQAYHRLLTGLSPATYEVRLEWYTDSGRTAWAYIGRQFSAQVIKR